MAKLTPIERFILEIPSDRRRAFDQRQLENGLKRVTVTVPVDEVENLKLFARMLRNLEPWILAQYKDQFSQYLSDSFDDFDEAVERGEA